MLVIMVGMVYNDDNVLRLRTGYLQPNDTMIL